MQLIFRPLGNREIDHELIWSLVGLIALCGIPGWVWLFGPPPLRCHFHDLLGIPCLTCGSTRALLALARLHPLEAIRWNPLCALCWMAWALYVPYGLAATIFRLPRLRLALSPRDWFLLRFLVPFAALGNWAWLILDKR